MRARATHCLDFLHRPLEIFVLCMVLRILHAGSDATGVVLRAHLGLERGVREHGRRVVERSDFHLLVMLGGEGVRVGRAGGRVAGHGGGGNSPVCGVPPLLRAQLSCLASVESAFSKLPLLGARPAPAAWRPFPALRRLRHSRSRDVLRTAFHRCPPNERSHRVVLGTNDSPRLYMSNVHLTSACPTNIMMVRKIVKSQLDSKLFTSTQVQIQGCYRSPIRMP